MSSVSASTTVTISAAACAAAAGACATDSIPCPGCGGSYDLNRQGFRHCIECKATEIITSPARITRATMCCTCYSDYTMNSQGQLHCSTCTRNEAEAKAKERVAALSTDSLACPRCGGSYYLNQHGHLYCDKCVITWGFRDWDATNSIACPECSGGYGLRNGYRNCDNCMLTWVLSSTHNNAEVGPAYDRTAVMQDFHELAVKALCKAKMAATLLRNMEESKEMLRASVLAQEIRKNYVGAHSLGAAYCDDQAWPGRPRAGAVDAVLAESRVMYGNMMKLINHQMNRLDGPNDVKFRVMMYSRALAEYSDMPTSRYFEGDSAAVPFFSHMLDAILYLVLHDVSGVASMLNNSLRKCWPAIRRAAVKDGSDVDDTPRRLPVDRSTSLGQGLTILNEFNTVMRTLIYYDQLQSSLRPNGPLHIHGEMKYLTEDFQRACLGGHMPTVLALLHGIQLSTLEKSYFYNQDQKKVATRIQSHIDSIEMMICRWPMIMDMAAQRGFAKLQEFAQFRMGNYTPTSNQFRTKMEDWRLAQHVQPEDLI